MYTRSRLHSIVFGIIFLLLAACVQKAGVNSPEVAKQKAIELRSAVPKTFVRSFADHVVRITDVSKEKDTLTAIEPDGTFRTYAISAMAKTVDEIIMPNDPNYANYAHMFQDESVAMAIRRAGQYAFVVDRKGTIGEIVNDPSSKITLTADVRWHPGTMVEKSEISWLAKQLIRVVPVGDKDYEVFASKYCRGEKAR